MSQICPDCGSKGAVAYFAEVGQPVCSDCGAVSQELQTYDACINYDVSHYLGAPSGSGAWSDGRSFFLGSSGRHLWTNSLQESRQKAKVQRKPEVDNRIKAVLAALGHPGLFERVDFLFQHARDASWRGWPEGNGASYETLPFSGTKADSDRESPSTRSTHSLDNFRMPGQLIIRRVRWGLDSLYLAVACCYAVLRREGVRIDLETVSAIAQLPCAKVRRSFMQLKLLVKGAVGNVQLANPDVYIHRIVTYFYFHLALRPGNMLGASVSNYLKPLRSAPKLINDRAVDVDRILTNTPFEAVERIALDLCEFWWPHRNRTASDPRLAAFSIVIVALEANLKAHANLQQIFRHTYQALRFDPVAVFKSSSRSQIDDGTAEDPLSKAALELYREAMAFLSAAAMRLPWLLDLSSNAEHVRTKRGSKANATMAPTALESSRSAGEPAPSSKRKTFARRNLVQHTADLLAIWRAVPARFSEGNCGAEDSTTSSMKVPTGQGASTDDRDVARDVALDSGTSVETSMADINADELECFVALACNDRLFDILQPHDKGTRGERQPVGSNVVVALKAAEGVNNNNDHPIRKMYDENASSISACEEFWPKVQQRVAGATSAPISTIDGQSPPHPIDRLSEEQVDELLFSRNELASIFRTDPHELAAFEHAKVAAGEWQPDSPGSLNHRQPTSVAAADQQTGLKRKKNVNNVEQKRTGKKRCRRPDEVHPLSQPTSLHDQAEESDWSD